MHLQLRSGTMSFTIPHENWYRREGPWPRHAFTSRGGFVLHNRACGGLEVSRVVPMEYKNHKELEDKLVSHGMMLCHCCRSADGF